MSSIRIMAFVLGAAALTAGCGGGGGRPSLPLSTEPRPEPQLTLVWVGRGVAHRFEDGAWKRIPDFDYEFQVVQRRYGDRWESVKEMHRRHPDYDRSAGPRDQSYSFQIRFDPAQADGQVKGAIWSTLGDGAMATDREFRKATIEIDADVSSHAPFDTYRIQQDYRYEQGVLSETVLLLKKKGGSGERVWVRNEEEAKLFAVRTFDAPPTTR